VSAGRFRPRAETDAQRNASTLRLGSGCFDMKRMPLEARFPSTQIALDGLRKKDPPGAYSCERPMSGLLDPGAYCPGRDSEGLWLTTIAAVGRDPEIQTRQACHRVRGIGRSE